MELSRSPHRRHDPLTGRWVLVSPHRTDRPWQGREESGADETRPPYDPDCYLCPGNPRASGDHNPDYDTTFVFDNDFPALRPDTDDDSWASSALLRAQGQPGTCRVLCFHPRHDLTMARMSVPQIRAVVDLWADQVAALVDRFPFVQIFENRGAEMGASNSHPHGQLWATTRQPDEVAREDRQQRHWHHELGAPLLVAYGEQEQDGDRVVVANDAWLAVVPFWATWPFETLLLPRRHVRRLADLDDLERSALAEVLRALLIRYDNLFEHPFPYSMGWHAAPGTDGDDSHWQLHAHFYPPLLRSATVRKFMVGFELLGEAQRDLTAEEAARRLRDVDGRHHLEKRRT